MRDDDPTKRDDPKVSMIDMIKLIMLTSISLVHVHGDFT